MVLVAHHLQPSSAVPCLVVTGWFTAHLWQPGWSLSARHLHDNMLLAVDSTRQNLFVFWWEEATDSYFVQYRSKSIRVLSCTDWRFIPTAFVAVGERIISLSAVPTWLDLNDIIASHQVDCDPETTQEVCSYLRSLRDAWNLPLFLISRKENNYSSVFYFSFDHRLGMHSLNENFLAFHGTGPKHFHHPRSTA